MNKNENYIKVLDKKFDSVIKSNFITAVTNYKLAIEMLVPLINKYDQQRYTLSPSFYKRLEKDILNGCIMPALTLAINGETTISSMEDYKEIENELLKVIPNSFVLDGIQRLNTINRIALNDENIDLNRPIYLNIIVSKSLDKLLYRMITLNNGQRPMSARHQVEILTNNMFDFDNLPINTVTEKQQKINKKISLKTSFKKDDIVKSYLAFITDSINIDNQKIIESKMDELISDKIMDSNLPDRKLDYINVIKRISELIIDERLKKWFSLSNNLIGFSASISKSFDKVYEMSIDEIANAIDLFEKAFNNLDVSKIKLGLARRKAVKMYFDNITKYSNISVIQLTDIISQEV